MKLSQAILISLTLLICFSPTISLAMEESERDNSIVNFHFDDGDFIIDINDNILPAGANLAENEELIEINSLVQRLKNKHKEFFKNGYDLGMKERKLRFILNVIFCLPRFLSVAMLRSINYVFACGCRNDEYLMVVIVRLFLIAAIALSTLAIIYRDDIRDVIVYAVSSFLLLVLGLLLRCQIRENNIDLPNYFPDWFGDNEKEWQLKRLCFDNSHILDKKFTFKKSVLSKYLTHALTNVLFSDDMIELIFDKDAKFNVKDFGKIIEKASFERIKLLVDLGINVNSKDENGTPAIITAINNSKLQVIDLLLEKGVDIGVEDVNGKTVFDYINEFSEIERQVLREKFIQFRRKLAEQIYYALEELEFPQVHADLIAEYLV
ncbi:MAG: ankyrin repeat domain-containing protein [Candidatus Babeliales bacterium]|nr:ankyrin repeat domain-containing protein [Candidatus Babeliales bacterium]